MSLDDHLQAIREIHAGDQSVIADLRIENAAKSGEIETLRREIERLKNPQTPTPENPGGSYPPIDAAGDMPAVARFFDVPLRPVTEPTDLTLVATHINGVKSVMLGDAPATRIGDVFKVRFDPTGYRGAVKIKVVVTPNHGKPSVAEIDVWCGSPIVVPVGRGDHSLSGFDGGIGEWTIFEPEPGLSREDVRIVGGDNLKGRICLRNVTLKHPIKASTNADAWLWCDGVDYAGPGAGVKGSDVSRYRREYWTNCDVHDLHLGGVSDHVVGCRIWNVGEDPIRGLGLLANTSIRNVRDMSSHGKWHPDLAVHIEPKNVLLYGVDVEDCDAQGFDFGSGTQYDGVAMIDCRIQNRMAFCFGSKIASTSYRNFYARGCTFDGNTYFRRGGKYDGWTMHGPFVVEDCTFTQGKKPSGWEDEGVIIRER